MHISPVRDSPQGAVLAVHVQPNASKTEFAGLHGGALKFRVASPPVEGAANEALCAHLAGLFELSKKSVVVQGGQSSRKKRVLLAGVPADRVLAVLRMEAKDCG